ncbi:hypothetical protein FSARC_12160 [Fusarium sarcochroum]|uniref:Succinate--CoA ligase [ADP-forming] subunit beta, mitochondrial n=1 Tax=Fusarium sarcochroum TaxID=1208366 RepID=A0A8H4WXS1_9HYPO|nr:hypothetical protein FSARC_12160 [Fusarium sarcochroum]
MSIHEYQAQNLLGEAGVPVPRGEMIVDIEDVAAATQKVGKYCVCWLSIFFHLPLTFVAQGLPSVIKSQVLAGGRGKGIFDTGLKGGVHVVQTTNEASTISSQMLGHRLKTKQTKHDGLLVEKLYVTEKVAIEQEFYLSMAIDRNQRRPAIIVSRNGGMDIELAAKIDPKSVTRILLDYSTGVDSVVCSKVDEALGLTTCVQREDMKKLLTNMYRLFKARDATLLEINPLVITATGELICLDSKFSFDDAARSRQPDIFGLEEKTARCAREAEAERMGFSYVSLDGNIGNIVNGAGLAMATMDAINHYGGQCSNFLDAGGKATKETMIDAFRIVLGDERVKVIFINIYGGIIHGDMVASSIINAAEGLGTLRVPIVVRLQGTRAEIGQEILARCGLNIHSVNDFTEAVKLAVELASK